MQDDSFMPIFGKLFQMYINQGSQCGEEQNNTKISGKYIDSWILLKAIKAVTLWLNWTLSYCH